MREGERIPIIADEGKVAGAGKTWSVKLNKTMDLSGVFHVVVYSGSQVIL